MIRGSLKTNRIVKHIKPEVSENCTFCRLDIESITHLFWSCPISSEFRRNAYQYYNTWPEIRQITKKECIFGIKNEKSCSPLNFFMLYCNHYIWVTRCKKKQPTLQGFKNYFSFEIKIFKQCLDIYPDMRFLENVHLF